MTDKKEETLVDPKHLNDDFDFDEPISSTGFNSEDEPPIAVIADEKDKESISGLILNHISGSDLNNGYTDQLDRTDAFVSLIELLDKESVFKLPSGVYYFAYEMVNGPKKDKAKFLLWAQHKILTSSEINEKAKVEILKIFNTASALTVFGNMEWQIATV